MSACTSSSADPTTPTESPSAPSSPSTPEANGTTSSPSVAPGAEDAAVTAYEDDLAAVALAVEQDDEPVSPEEVATGQALAAAQARVVGLASRNRCARGQLVADVQEVEVDDGSATISGCHRNELVEYDLDTDEQAADHAGARFAAPVQLDRSDGESLAIARALFFRYRVLILDEPTSALAVRQAGRVLDHIRKAREAGAAVIFITHSFRHALDVADDIVILTQGRSSGTFNRGEASLERLTPLVEEGERVNVAANVDGTAGDRDEP